MTIGIYGDSFTTSHLPSRHFAWYNLLADKLGTTIYNHETNSQTTYGFGASSTFYAYKKFIKYHHLHEYNIFVASFSQKYTKLINLYGDDRLVPISGINSLEWYTSDPTVSSEGRDLLEKIRSWFFVNDEEYMDTAQELMLQDVEKKGGRNTIIITADIDASFCKERKEKSCIDFGLWDLTKVMWKEIGINGTNQLRASDEKLDKISCHMTEPTNRLFANMMYNHIKTGEKMILPEKINHEYTWEHYYG